MADPAPVLLGREFDAFDRALTRQLRAAGARHELPEILDLQERVVSGSAASSGEADVLMVVTDWLPALIAERKILPLDELIAAAPPEGWPDAWHPALRAQQRGPDGSTYGVPYHCGPQMLLYREDIYADPRQREGFARRFGYELAPPDTWSQYRDQARWFTDRENGRYGTILAGYPDEHNTVYDFLTQLWSRGGELVAGDGVTLTLDTPEAHEAARFLYGLWHTDRVVDPAAAEWDSVTSGRHFAAGEAAFMVNWAGFAAMAAGSPTEGKVGCAPVPRADGGKRVALNSYWVLAVAAGTRDPKAAYDVIREVSTPAMDRITAEEGGVATRRDNWSDAGVAALAPYYAQFERAHESVRSLPRDARWPRISAVLNDLVAALIAGGADPAALVLEAHARLSAISPAGKEN